jgi:hypothetical protein
MKRVPDTTRQFTAGAFQPGEAGATQMLRSLGSGDRGPALAEGLACECPWEPRISA